MSGPPVVHVRVNLYTDLVSRAGLRVLPLSIHRTGEKTTGLWLVEYIRLELGLAELAPVAIVRNGKPVLAADLVSIDVDDGDEFMASPRPQTGVDVLLIGLALASAAVSARLATRAKLPGIGATGDEGGPERRFGFNRFSNTAYVGDVKPVIYGRRRRYGGKIVAQVPVESSDGSGNAKLKILLCLCRKEIQAIGDRTADFNAVTHEQISGVFLNDQPIQNFPGAILWGRMGTDAQAVIPGFKDAETLREIGVGGVELRNTSGAERTGASASAEAFSFTTVGGVNAVVNRIRFPKGLFSIGSSQQVDPRRVQYRYRWRLHAGPGAYSAWTVITVERADQSEFYSSPRADSLVAGAGAQIDVQVERVSIEPAAGSLTEVDQIFWDSIVEVLYGSNAYAGHAMLAIEITAGEQLNGVPRVSVDMKGRKLRVWDGVSSPSSPVFVTQYTENPAWYALDWLTDADYGMGHFQHQPDYATLFAAAAYNDELVPRPAGMGTRARFRAHFAVDEPRQLWDWLRALCATFRCVPAPSGSVIRFPQKRPQATPVETFTDASIAADERGRPKIRYRREKATRGLQRPNQYVCQFENDLADGNPDVLAYPLDGQFWLGGASPESLNPKDIKLEGVTDPDQVQAELIFLMNENRYLTRTVSLTTTKRAVAAQALDRVDLSSDLPAWGLASGRIAASSSSGVIIDKTVTLSAGKTYFIRVTHADNTLEVKQILSPAGTYAAGTPLLLTDSWVTPPAEFCEYSLGETGRVSKPFTVTAVRLADSERLEWELDLLEYNEGTFTLSPGPIQLPGYSSLPHALTPPGPVTDLRATERTINAIHQVVLSWQQLIEDAQITESFRIYRRPVGLTAWSLEPHPSITYRSAVIELSEQDRAYEFTVIAVSYGGAAMSPYDPRAPIVSITMGLAAEPPPPPENPVVTLTGGNTFRLSWDPVPGATGYLVMTRGDTAMGLGSLTGPGGSLIGPGTRDAMILARTLLPELAGLELIPNFPQHFYIRATIASGRMSFESTGLSHTAGVPAGHGIWNNPYLDSASGGTLSNVSWVFDGVDTILRLTSPSSPGTWTSPVQSNAVAMKELNLQVITKNDAADPLLTDFPSLIMPSIAADQWGIVDDSPDRVVGMLQPPYPDDESAVKCEVRTHDGSVWSAWEVLAPCKTITRAFGDWQFRLTLTRKNNPYRLAVIGVQAMITWF